MNSVHVILAAVFVYNTVFVVFLAPYPVWSYSRSLGTAFWIGIGVGTATAIVGTTFAIVYQYVLVPLNAMVLGTMALTALIVVFAMVAERLGANVFPHHVDAVRRTVPVVFANAGVFVVAYALAESATVPLEIVPLAGFSAGVGVSVALLPVAAVRRRSRRFPLLKAMRGETLLWFAGAVISLAFLYINRIFAPLGPSLW